MHPDLTTLVARGDRGRYSLRLSLELDRMAVARERTTDRRYGRLPDGTMVSVTAPCPQCGSPLYDPHDRELVAECLVCGTVLYGGASEGLLG